MMRKPSKRKFAAQEPKRPKPLEQQPVKEHDPDSEPPRTAERPFSQPGKQAR